MLTRSGFMPAPIENIAHGAPNTGFIDHQRAAQVKRWPLQQVPDMLDNGRVRHAQGQPFQVPHIVKIARRVLDIGALAVDHRKGYRPPAHVAARSPQWPWDRSTGQVHAHDETCYHNGLTSLVKAAAMIAVGNTASSGSRNSKPVLFAEPDRAQLPQFLVKNSCVIRGQSVAATLIRVQSPAPLQLS
jgi:hypothetical protein